MRFGFGSELPELLGQPINELNLLRLYVATAVALDQWEPRFQLTESPDQPAVQVSKADADGFVEITLNGIYLPGGHLGDFSRAEPVTATIAIRALYSS